jgi:hypothetical protein
LKQKNLRDGPFWIGVDQLQRIGFSSRRDRQRHCLFHGGAQRLARRRQIIPVDKPVEGPLRSQSFLRQ